MTDLAQFRILYVGRKVQFADYLHRLFEQQNQIAHEQRSESRSSRQLARIPGMDEWIAVHFSKVTNQKAALQLIRTRPPTAVIVELEQKPTSRLRFCEVVRYRLPTVAILALAAKVPKDAFPFDGTVRLPFVDAEIIDLIRTLGTQRAQHVLKHGPILLNIAARTVSTPSGQYPMTPKQCALLKLLMSNQGEVVERGKIMESVWETSYMEDTRTLDVHIRWLRERIEQNPSKPVYLKTIRGVGYRFSVNGHDGQ